MGILNVLFRNSSQASRTREPANIVAYPAGFRGALDHQTEQCVGCTTCNYVCSPGAIQFVDAATDGITWQYKASQCTFCGRCVEYCPTKALHFEQYAPVMTNSPEMIYHRIEYHPCPKCGELFAPLPLPTVERLCGGYAPETMIRLMKLCEKCRNRATVEVFKESLRGELHFAGGKQ